MKYFTIALFLGVISTNDIELEEAKAAINALKIRVSKAGQKKIEKEAHDVAIVADKIKNRPVTLNLKHALQRWAKSKEAFQLKKLNRKFLASPEGKRLVKEWKDVGRVLDQSIVETKNGIHIPNKALDQVGKELDDVAYQYKTLEGTDWDKAYDYRVNKLMHNKEAAFVKMRGKQFKHSPAGQALKKEMQELKWAIKKNVKVSDLPKDMTNMLKIEVSKEGQAIIEKEANDVGAVWDQVKETRPFRNMGASLERWADTPQVHALEELDKKFLASPEGKRLVAEWTDFGEALKEAIKETEDGIHIENDHLDMIGDELDDVAHEYKKLEKSAWADAYKKGWEDALHTEEAEGVARRFQTFEKSNEWKVLEQELKELDMAIKENLKVTDLPEDVMSAIHIKITDPKPIEKAADEVIETAKEIQNSRPVRNLQSSLERWGESPEAQAAGKLEQEFLQSPDGKRLMTEWNDVFATLNDTVYESENHVYINNDHLQAVEDELQDVEYEYKRLDESAWKPKFEQAYGAAFNNKEAQSAGRRFKSFEHSPEGQALGEDIDAFGDALEKNVKVTDIPKRWQDTMYLF